MQKVMAKVGKIIRPVTLRNYQFDLSTIKEVPVSAYTHVGRSTVSGKLSQKKERLIFTPSGRNAGLIK